jgi:hypothetical protein
MCVLLSYRQSENLSVGDSAASYQTAGWSVQWETRLLQEVVHAGNNLAATGVIWAVRDPIFQAQRDKESGEVTEVKIDNGIQDKRLFIGETEFAQALK